MKSLVLSMFENEEDEFCQHNEEVESCLTCECYGKPCDCDATPCDEI